MSSFPPKRVGRGFGEAGAAGAVEPADIFGPAPTVIVDVLAPAPMDAPYSWRADRAMNLAPGDIVEMPLGPRETVGLVVGVREGRGDNLKPISAKRDLPRLSPAMLAFLDRFARWTLTPRGMAARMVLRGADHVAPPPPRLIYRATGATPERLSPARKRVLAALEEGFSLPKRALAEAAGVSPSVIDGLTDAGALEIVVAPPQGEAAPDPDFHVPALEPAQAQAAEELRARLRAGGFWPALLEGVTGSGKTEVYFEAVAQALREGGQALILMPEIALTGQFLDRFAARFGVRPDEWHSGVSSRRRGRVWEEAAEGSARVVVGARSALFLPFRDLRLIVVDEEHESAYKQDDGVAYHARDMAVLRAQTEKAAVVLASATPSIETRYNAETGRYGWLRLEARARGARLPDVAILDLRRDPPPRGRWISPPLAQALAANLERGEQSLLFLNRRGYAPLTLCRACGHRFQCPQCTSWLVEHRFRRALMCHQCGHVERRPDVCPECGGENTLQPCGPGIERLAEEAKLLFPQARLMALSSDFPGGIERLRREFEAVAQGEVDILIGTQLVAKGHNFPLMTLVGVVDADISAGGADPRAAERSFQLLRQATGRAGRGARPGIGLLQSWRPDDPVVTALASGDQERFYAEEIQARRAGALPPFARLAAIVVSATDRSLAETHARAIARSVDELAEGFPLAAPGELARPDAYALLGPAEAPIAMARGRYRFRLLARAPRHGDLQGFVRALISASPRPRGSLRVAIDVEPLNFF